MPEVRISEKAAAQAEQLDAWWAENRPLAPALFAREFASAVALLGVAPGAGARFRRSALPGVRRFVLQKTRNLVFYIYSREIDVVHIIAVWGGPKGSDPPLELP
jgi:plasmid stabilization system protein ParE